MDALRWAGRKFTNQQNKSPNEAGLSLDQRPRRHPEKQVYNFDHYESVDKLPADNSPNPGRLDFRKRKDENT